MLKVTHADGSAKNYTYSGRTTKIVDENGVNRMIQVDGLGRTTAVCEVSSNTLQSQAPADCKMDITATGFLTTYAYSTDTNAANAQQVTVTQGGQSRTFETDFLGRTTLVKEPESSTTTYSYAYSSTSGFGLTVTRIKPTANQSNASVTTKTVTQYDSVGRVVSVTYTDGTPTKTFTYDKPDTSWTESGNQTNLLGGLSSHSRTTGAGRAASMYGDDAMGRVTLQYSCVPSSCGTAAYDRKVPYMYNTAGMLTREGDGAGDTYTYTRSIAGEITGMTDSFSDATDPADIIVPKSVQNGPFGPTNYNLGNGLTAVNTYDSMGRHSGGFVCAGSSQPSCTGGTSQVYGFANMSTGTHVTESCDTVLNVCNSFGYDEFNRLTSRTVNQGTGQNFTYTYDRDGNRWQQNAPQGGPTLNITFNQDNNIISTTGFTNDVVGNLSNDTFHTYSYDADGNLISVDGGQTASYYYDSLNQRVRIAPTRGTYEFVWDIFGRRVSNWSASNHSFAESNAYTDSGPIAIRSGGQRQFEHQNWLGTERVRTTYNGGVAISIASLPWADEHTPSSDNGDQHDFAGTDRDLEDSTEHAQYRQFSTNIGRWLSPDPYLGSYDFNNPQSLNRYSYALNDPINLLDPSGLTINCTMTPNGLKCTDDHGSNAGTNDPIDCNGNFAVCVNAPTDCVAQGTEGCITVTNPGTPGPDGPGSATAPSGSSGGSINAPNNGLAQIQRVSGCIGQALGSNAASLLLDVAGVALTVSPIGAEAKVVGAIALGTASTVVGAVEANTTSTKGVLAAGGAFANIFGIQTAPLELAQEFAQFSRGAGKLLTGVGIGADLASVGLDLKGCLGQQP